MNTNQMNPPTLFQAGLPASTISADQYASVVKTFCFPQCLHSFVSRHGFRGHHLSSVLLASTKLWTSLAIARRATAGLFTLTFTLPLSSFADATVPTQTVGSGQTLTVVDPGKVDTATPGPVQVLSGGKAVIIGGTSVVLKPGFKADSGSLFRASQDLNLAGLEDLDDTDFDGLPDAWEMLHFGNLTSATGTGDNDSDGVSNAAEYRAGTSPGLNEASAGWPAGAQVVLKMPNGKFQKVLTDWSITNAP